MTTEPSVWSLLCFSVTAPEKILSITMSIIRFFTFQLIKLLCTSPAAECLRSLFWGMNLLAEHTTDFGSDAQWTNGAEVSLILHVSPQGPLEDSCLNSTEIFEILISLC